MSTKASLVWSVLGVGLLVILSAHGLLDARSASLHHAFVSVPEPGGGRQRMWIGASRWPVYCFAHDQDQTYCASAGAGMGLFNAYWVSLESFFGLRICDVLPSSGLHR
jgi:hypothetical protein